MSKFKKGQSVILANGGKCYSTDQDFAAYHDMEGYIYQKSAYGYVGEVGVIVAIGGYSLGEKYGVQMEDGTQFIMGVAGLKRAPKPPAPPKISLWERLLNFFN